jgi:hypothetical protein
MSAAKDDEKRGKMTTDDDRRFALPPWSFQPFALVSETP